MLRPIALPILLFAAALGGSMISPAASASCVAVAIQEGPFHLADAQAGTSCQPWVVVYKCTAYYFGGPPGLYVTCVPFIEGPVISTLLA